MVLLKILRPADVPDRKTNWGYRLRIYHWLLLRLLPTYRKCAISDALNLGGTQIIHNVRDYWYEQELQRFRIDTAQHLGRQNVPLYIKRKNRRSFFFNWSESLLVFHDGKSYNVKRSDTFSVETELEGQLKMSEAKDFILRTEYVAKDVGLRKSSKTEDTIEETTSPRQSNEKPSRQRVPVKDIILTESLPAKPAAETIKYRGFEESSIF